MPALVSDDLLREVLAANRRIATAGLAHLTWGNVSGIDREAGIYVIKPSGVAYDDLTVDALVLVDVESGEVVEGSLKPSTDDPTHRLLYQSFPSIGGVTHTHSTSACAFAQAERDIPVLGTTHADTFNGPVRCTRQLTADECAHEYELNTGRALVELFADEQQAAAVPGALAVSHGPFLWGSSARQSLEHAIVVEAVAEMALRTLALNPSPHPPQHLLDRHFTRKHGPDAYYGNAPR